jgi:hypothetical protein
VLLLCSYGYTRNHSLFNKDTYFKSKIFNNKVNHLYRVAIIKDNVPLYNGMLDLVAGNVYYLFFDGGKIIKRINNTIIQDQEHKAADLTIFTLRNGLLKILVPSTGAMFMLNPGENLPVEVHKLGLINMQNVIYFFTYIKSF